MLEAQQFQNIPWLVWTKRSEPSQFWSVAHQHGEAKALGPLAVKMTAAFSGQGAVERYHKSIGLHRDRYANLKRPDTVPAICKIKAAQIFKRNKELQSKSKRNVLYMIKDVFNEMAAVRAERERLCEYLALARASTEMKIKMHKLIWVRLMLTRMQNMRPFSKRSIRPLTEISTRTRINCFWFFYLRY